MVIKEKVGGGSGSVCLSGVGRNGPRNGEMPENEVNLARRFINLANILGAGNWERGELGRKMF